ncbi:hypothetical protein BJ138DRAFT_980743, partial [Hygrophoropsis aurantiaca]
LFSSQEHPQFLTHLNYVRPAPLIPVLLAERVPRLDKTPEEDEQWYRLMLLLFKPWRNFDDLLGTASSWKEAFSEFHFSADSKRLMHNMNIENECRDARDHAR